MVQDTGQQKALVRGKKTAYRYAQTAGVEDQGRMIADRSASSMGLNKGLHTKR